MKNLLLCLSAAASLACATADTTVVTADTTTARADELCVDATFTLSGATTSSGPYFTVSTNRVQIPACDVQFFRLKRDCPAGFVSIQSTTNLLSPWTSFYTNAWDCSLPFCRLSFGNE